ncbi:hypothetical protein QYE76_019179 [Lolium multiflorum]|uniref:Transposase (putative) gypsy type domain-containing protein n=1 Tax=Lolium multiflorum TaxID=4521 RepID=A0AAD8R4I3_LOLMU|nr:hypothetical protein QYE76_019179 [Lolium multiflorum]
MGARSRELLSGRDPDLQPGRQPDEKARPDEEEGSADLPQRGKLPNAPIQYRVSFVDHLIRGLSAPIHEFLRGLLFVYGLQLHQLTPNSILHISIFITLCECFLGIHPNWALWKRIFYLRRNGSHNIAYNIGGVVICVRPDVEYFDIKFPDSVQGWRRRWLYVREECPDSLEYNIAPFDGSAKILRRRSWDAEASEEEKTATEALMKRIHELQNTRGKELSGIQITAHFLRIRVQPLQARKNPLWLYAGDKDVDRISEDLSVKDLEKLVRRVSSLSKKDSVPSSCRVEPFNSTNPLPKKCQVLSSLPPLPEGGEVDDRAIVADDAQGTSRPESEIAGSHKSAGSSERETESEASESAHSLPSAVSPRSKRKKGDVEYSGTSKLSGSPAEEASPEEEGAFDPYADALISSGEEEEEPAVNVTAPTSTSQTLVLSETRRATEENSPPPQDLEMSTPVASPRAPEPKRARIELGEEQGFLAGSSSTPSLDDPLMKHFISLGTQFIGYRDTVEDLKEALAKVNKRADDLATNLDQSEKARKKAEQDAASVGDLRKRLHQAENALSEKTTQQIAREEAIIGRLESQNRRFARKMGQDFELQEPEGDRLLDALSLLEIHGDLARCSIADARTTFTRLFPYFFPKKNQPEAFTDLAKHFIPEEDFGLAFRQGNLKIGVEGTIALVAESQQNVDWARTGETKRMNNEKWQSLIKAAKPHSKKILSFLGYKPATPSSSARPEVK